MNPSLKILSPGMLSSIQDKGRVGFAGFGVPRSGAIDPVTLRLANQLVGNDPYEPAIEFRFMGPTLVAENGSVRLGLGGYFAAKLVQFQTNETQQISPWQSVTLLEGDILKIEPLEQGTTGYIAIEGGLQLSPVLASCSTYERAKLGGVTGAALQFNDVLKVKHEAAPRECEKIISKPVAITDDPLHIILGPQDDYFSKETINSFLSTPFKVSTDVDRMGIRLEGTEVTALADKGSDLISDGLVVGAIQVPGNGQPIILCVDCQSVGGYPKIATVVSADLYRLGQMKPGQEILFKAIDLDQASTLYSKIEDAITSAIASIHDYHGEGVVDLSALYQANLVGGVVDAQNPGHIPGHLED